MIIISTCIIYQHNTYYIYIYLPILYTHTKNCVVLSYSLPIMRGMPLVGKRLPFLGCLRLVGWIWAVVLRSVNPGSFSIRVAYQWETNYKKKRPDISILLIVIWRHKLFHTCFWNRICSWDICWTIEDYQENLFFFQWRYNRNPVW